MNRTQHVLKRMLYIINKVLEYIFLSAMLLILMIGVYALWDSKMVYEQADCSNWKAYKPTYTSTASFDDLITINPDVWGWLNIYGTNIDNPLLCSDEESHYYINHDAKGEPSLVGALYTVKHTDSIFDDFNTIIYGHHMANNLMFGGLDKYEEQSYLDSHPYGIYSFIDDNGVFQTKGIEVVGLLKTDAYDSKVYRSIPVNSKYAQPYVESLVDSMKTRRNVSWNGNRVLLLSTCAGGITNARTVVVCYVVDDIKIDTFEENTKILDSGHKHYKSVQFRVGISILILLLGLILGYYFIGNKNKSAK